MQNSILDFSLQELKQEFKGRGISSFRAEQIFNWIYQRCVFDFDAMKNLPLDLRSQLKRDFYIVKAEIVEKQKSSDGTEKFLFRLEDKELIEAVCILTKARNTVCLSSQVGCKFKCLFCASGLAGFKRNLSCAEIISQLLLIKKLHYKDHLNNVVMMGMGEPLDNYEQVMKAVRIMNDKEGLNIGARKITISTCGLIPQIERLSKEGMQFELSISLHAADNKTRDFLMPVNKKYPLEKLINAAKKYITKTNRQVTFEYVLIEDVNSTSSQAELLSRLLKDLNCKVNLIPYNPINGIKFSAPTNQEVQSFKQILTKGKINTTLRKSRGQDIDASCGQLRLIKNCLSKGYLKHR